MHEAQAAPKCGSETERRSIGWRVAPIILGLVLATVCLRGPLLRWNLNVADEGYLAWGSQRVMDGQVIYRDFHRNYPPGIYYLFASLFSLFGSDFMLTRIVSLVFLCAICSISYLLLRPIVPPWLAIWAALVPVLIQSPVHKMFVPLSAIGGLVLCKWSLKGNSGGWRPIWLGLGAGFIALFRQDAAGFAWMIIAGSAAVKAVSDVAGLRVDMRRAALRLLAYWLKLAVGSAAVWIPLAVALAAAGGALNDMFEQLIMGGLRDNARMGIPFPDLAMTWAKGISFQMRVETALFYFPVAVATAGLLLAMWRALRRSAGGWPFLGQLSLMTLLMHSAFLQRSDLPHLKQIIVLPVLVLALLAGECLGWIRKARPGPLSGTVGWVLIAVLLGWLAVASWWGYETDLARAYRENGMAVQLDEPKARFMVSKTRLKLVNEIAAKIRELTSPGDPIFVAPYAPMFYFLTDRINPTRYDVLFPGAVSSVEVQREIIGDMESAGVKVVVIRDIEWDGKKERRFARYAPVITKYLESRYREVLKTGKWAVLVKKGLAQKEATVSVETAP